MGRTGRCRSDLRYTCANALVWAVGNGLFSTFLVGYLAQDLGAGAVAVAWLVAAPRFAGLLRVAAPAAVRWAAARGLGRKGFCLAGYVASAGALAVVPLSTWGADDSTPDAERAARIAGLVLAWCAYHLLEQAATVLLWSWLGDLYPARVRARLLGVRERFLTLGRFLGLGASVLLAGGWGWATGDPSARTPLAVSAWAGVVVMLAAVAPLAGASALGDRPSATPVAPWRGLVAALRERPYRRLLAYHAWLAMANGLTGSAHFTYPRLMGLGYGPMQAAFAGMWLGQSLAAPAFGRLVGRFGAKRVILPAQLVVATGPLWFFCATREAPWWVFVAYGVWVAYAAVNVGLDALKLTLADARNNAPYLALFQAVGDFAAGVTVLLGGLLYETLAAGDSRALQAYGVLFVAGWGCRTLAAGLVLRLEGPPRRGSITMGE